MTDLQPADTGWIQTCTGGVFFPMAPRIEDIRIRDIAGSLSKMCRYAGHCNRFYSVAEHSVLVASKAPPNLQLAALMHDASEAYLVDIPRPLKPHLGGYFEAESRLMEVISAKYNLEFPLPAAVKLLDAAILTDEREQNMTRMEYVNGCQWGNPHPAIGVKLRFLNPPDAEAAFLDAFAKYGGVDAPH